MTSSFIKRASSTEVEEPSKQMIDERSTSTRTWSSHDVAISSRTIPDKKLHRQPLHMKVHMVHGDKMCGVANESSDMIYNAMSEEVLDSVNHSIATTIAETLQGSVNKKRHNSPYQIEIVGKRTPRYQPRAAGKRSLKQDFFTNSSSPAADGYELDFDTGDCIVYGEGEISLQEMERRKYGSVTSYPLFIEHVSEESPATLQGQNRKPTPQPAKVATTMPPTEPGESLKNSGWIVESAQQALLLMQTRTKVTDEFKAPPEEVSALIQKDYTDTSECFLPQSILNTWQDNATSTFCPSISPQVEKPDTGESAEPPRRKRKQRYRTATCKNLPANLLGSGFHASEPITPPCCKWAVHRKRRPWSSNNLLPPPPYIHPNAGASMTLNGIDYDQLSSLRSFAPQNSQVCTSPLTPLNDLSQHKRHTNDTVSLTSASITNPNTVMPIRTRYDPLAMKSVHERQRCHTTCYRYNSSGDPSYGIPLEGRMRLFWDILRPKNMYASHSSVSPTMLSTQVKDGSVVDAPFNCDYGYNIHIGEDVAIGRNCTILDASEVSIGDRSVLGPNVSIYTVELHANPRRRIGRMTTTQIKPVIIEEDCFIGGGTIILPGVRIHKGSTVGAGSTVTKDVMPCTTVCGSPARVIRHLQPHE